MSENFFKFRSNNGRIFECFPDERGCKPLTATEARQQLNSFYREIEHLKARVAELEKKAAVNMSMVEVADLAFLALGLREELFVDRDEKDTEIIISQNVTLDNEDGTCTTWPLAFYWADCPEEGFTGIGDDPGAKPIKEPANEGGEV